MKALIEDIEKFIKKIPFLENVNSGIIRLWIIFVILCLVISIDNVIGINEQIDAVQNKMNEYAMYSMSIKNE